MEPTRAIADAVTNIVKLDKPDAVSVEVVTGPVRWFSGTR